MKNSLTFYTFDLIELKYKIKSYIWEILKDNNVHVANLPVLTFNAYSVGNQSKCSSFFLYKFLKQMYTGSFQLHRLPIAVTLSKQNKNFILNISPY